MQDGGTRLEKTAGRTLFALLLLAFALFLAVSYPGQTSWVAKTKWAAQPGFWPAVGVGGMVLFTLLHLLNRRRLRLTREDRAEGLHWLAGLEYVAWFLVYVWLVPRIGYVVASLVFVPALSWRVRYRSAKMLGIAAGFALVVVVLFKALLEVKIPGGALYDYLPDALRSFFILNL